jgi:DNA-binding MarR family transcriptional regulator
MVRTRSTVKAQPGLLLQPFVVSQLTSVLVNEVVGGSEVAGPEFALTSWLAVVDGATPTELARDLGLAPTTLSAMIDRLVHKRQVRRVRHPDDGRSYRLELTARGKATNTRNVARFAKVIARLRANLDGDEEAVLDALRTLEAALRATIDGA